MPLEIRTPFSRDAAQRQGDTWRKRVLPVGQIEYQGRLLHFDKAYLEGLAQAFNARAYDQVPFQLADAKNQHTNDPERFRGEVQKMDVGSDGLYVTVKTTEAGNAVLSANPKLGISARIVEDYARSDGKYYPVAIQHVLGTLDPRVNDLGSWERVDLSNGVAPDMLIDLSAATFAGEQEGGTITMPELDADQSARLGRLLELDPDKLNQVLDTLGSGSEGTSDLSEDDLAQVIATMPDDEFAALQAEFEIEPEYEYEPELVGAGLSNSGYGFSDIELANYQINETQRQLGVLQAEHDRTSFEAEKQVLIRRYNVPPFVAELARPLLEGSGHTVELSNGAGVVDAGLVVRQILQAFGQVTRDLGLDSPVELGTAMDEPDTTRHAEQKRADFVSDFRQYVGI